MGPQGLRDAFPRGGRFIDEFPVNEGNCLEGFITKHWASNKSEGCSMTKPEEVSCFVSSFLF